MGYTHYYDLNPKGKQKEYEKAKEAIRMILEKSPVRLGDGGGDKPICKEDYADSICFNGIGEDAHETFFIPDKLSDLKHPDYVEDKTRYVFNFTKTAHKPYDVVVTACLTVLRHYLRDDVHIRSDGGEDGFEEGMGLAAKILGRRFQNPCFDLENSVEFIKET